MITINTMNKFECDRFIRKYEILLRMQSVRTINILSKLREEYTDDISYLQYILNAKPHQIMAIRNCGKRTLHEIQNLVELLKDDCYCVPNNSDGAIADDTASDISTNALKQLPSNIDKLYPIFLKRLEGLSTRTCNCIISILNDCNKSLTRFYECISSPKRLDNLKSIGKKSLPEIKDFFQNSRIYLEQFTGCDDVSKTMRHYYLTSEEKLALPESSLELLQDKENELGYFPIFLAIREYLSNLSSEEHTLINDGLNIYNDQTLLERSEIATILSLTVERVRQKRNKIICNLGKYFEQFSEYDFFSHEAYSFQMRQVDHEINSAEGTNFNLNFISWVLSCISKDISLIGDTTKAIGGYYDIDSTLCIVPTHLLHYFDFEGFMSEVRETYAQKRINEENIALNDLINRHLKVQYCDDELKEIELTCRTIFYLFFPLEVDMGKVIFPANSRKNNPIIIEEILRNAGHPMTLDELYDEFMYLYPERTVMYESFRGNINNNPNIVPIGRTSTYALAEWNSTEFRGGTIRLFVQEIIDSSAGKIVSIDDVTNYVTRFRPETDEAKILSNLSQDSDGTYKFYFKDGLMYVGYSSETYSDEYYPYEGSARSASNNSIRFPELAKFIEEHGRFPVSTDDEEHYLYSFWRKRYIKYEANELDPHTNKCVENILDKYGHLYHLARRNVSTK